MSEVKLANIPQMNVGRVVEELTNVYSAVIRR